MRKMLLIPLVLALACTDDPKVDDSEAPDDSASGDSAPELDEDGDGTPASQDCDDSDPAVHPSAAELCDGVDNNCDGLLDDADPTVQGATTWYSDADQDGYGDPASSALACAAPTGAVAEAGDCDDDNAAVNPAAAELCDGLDNDCDGLADDDDPTVGGQSTWYIDYDGDGAGSDAFTAEACAAPGGYVASADDCDDTDAAAFPGGVEVCDGVDNDCNGEADGEDATDILSWYADEDGDGYGDALEATLGCEQPSGYVGNADDCDDLTALASPAGLEVCDGLDNDCDGSTDPSTASDAGTWYTDSDNDGYGDPSASTRACTKPTGTVANSRDCDDGDKSVSPAGTEVCDSADTDEDCDGLADDDDSSVASSGLSTWYLDADGDGYGDETLTTEACDAPSGYVSAAGDCDDSDSSTQDCACSIKSVATPTNVDTVSTIYGAWMTDPLETLGAGLVWEMTSYTGSTVVQYPSEAAFIAGSGGTTITLPTSWEGTGAVVYDGYLYYVQYNSNTLSKYDLSARTTVATLTLTGAGYHNTYHYQWGGWSDIDLAVDEQGLWAIYATSANSGKIVISAIDTASFKVTNTWNTGSSVKTSLGNAFMICGVLYTTGSYSSASTTINYKYDTATSTGTGVSILFSNPGGYNTQLNYNPADQLIYSWDYGRRQTYSLTLE